MSELKFQRVMHYLNNQYPALRQLIEKEIPNADKAQVDTRVLVGHVLKQHCQIEDDEKIYQHITDGQNDRGIDGLYFDENLNKLTVIQSKYSSNSNATAIAERDMGEFANGIREIIRNEIFSEQINNKLENLKGEVEKFLCEFDAKLEIITVTTSNRPLTKGAKSRIDRLLKREFESYEDDGSGLHLHIGLDLLYESMRPAELSNGTNFELELTGVQAIALPHTGYYGCISGEQIAQIVDEKGDAIFAKNLRKALGSSSDVNRDIIKTAEENPESFWYFNNGITIVAEKVRTARGLSSDVQRLKLSNGSIVNGAQTASSLHSLYSQSKDSLAQVKCLVRIINLPDDDLDFARDITRWNNSQNSVGAKDFVSLDPFQVDLRNSLNDTYGIIYAIRSGDDINNDAIVGEKITLQEATLGLVCSGDSVENVVRAKSHISSIWRDTDAEPYTTVFDKERVDATVVVKAVDFLRFVDTFLMQVRKGEILQTSGSDLGNLDKMKQLASHGNRLFCHYLMKRFDFFRKEETRDQFREQYKSLDIAEEFTCFSQVVFASFPNSYLARLFKNATKSKQIINELA